MIYMARQRGSPDRRGMGAQSDFISETFVPDDSYKLQQLAMIEKLIAVGISREQLETMFLISPELLSSRSQKDR
jgi:hypothetical protein